MALPSYGGTWSGRVADPTNARTVVMPNSRIDDRQLTPYGQMADDALIARFQAGEEHAYRYLVERHQERIRNLLYSMFHDSAVVEDMTQEVFIKAYQALPRFRFESSFYTWIYRIAINKSRDEIRRKKVRRFLSFQPLDEGIERNLHDKQSHRPEMHDAKELIGLGLQMLPEKFRSAVVLKDLEGLSYEEMADVMQCEIGTVKSRLSRGRAMLRTALKPLLKEGDQ
jgi:RNA polymerase sigma-70 factor (ECF subfamily)